MSSLNPESSPPIFVHSALDDYGLTPIDFRVLARVARRMGANGKCWESAPSMARGIGLNVKTVRAALARLVTLKLLTETLRSGDTSIFQINSIEQWQTLPVGQPYPSDGYGSGTDREAARRTGSHSTHDTGRHPTRRTGNKGTPRRESQKESQKGMPAPTESCRSKGGLYPSEHFAAIKTLEADLKAAKEKIADDRIPDATKVELRKLSRQIRTEIQKHKQAATGIDTSIISQAHQSMSRPIPKTEFSPEEKMRIKAVEEMSEAEWIAMDNARRSKRKAAEPKLVQACCKQCSAKMLVLPPENKGFCKVCSDQREGRLE